MNQRINILAHLQDERTIWDNILLHIASVILMLSAFTGVFHIGVKAVKYQHKTEMRKRRNDDDVPDMEPLLPEPDNNRPLLADLHSRCILDSLTLKPSY